MTGTGTLIRFLLRRDRYLILLWAVVPSLVPAVFVAAFRTGFPSPAALQEYADTSIHTTAFAVTYGVLRGSSLGELVTWRAGFLPVMVGLFCLLTVLRHTRKDEEDGRRELISSTVVGRHAGLAAAVITTCGAVLLLGTLSALVLMANGLPAAGSWAFGSGLAASGWAFAAIGAIGAQLTTGTGAARGIAVATLGFAFLLRGIGDVSEQAGGGLGWISWLSPIGWAGLARPFSGERWWVLILTTAVTVSLVAVAVALSRRRDLGSGLIPSRPGPSVAAPSLSTPLALATRLQGAGLWTRTAGFAVVGFALGAIATSIANLLNGATPAARAVLDRLGGRSEVLDEYFAGMVTVVGLAAAVFAIQSALRLRVEESSGRGEPVLAGPVDRLHWAAGHLAFAVLGPLLWLAAAGIGIGVGYGASTGDISGEPPRILAAMLVQLPAVWVFAGLAFALFGLAPRLAAGTFAVLLVSELFGWLGGELPVLSSATALSVFGHVPQLLGDGLQVLPLIVLTALATGLLGIGALALRRRDMPIG